MKYLLTFLAGAFVSCMVWLVIVLILLNYRPATTGEVVVPDFRVELSAELLDRKWYLKEANEQYVTAAAYIEFAAGNQFSGNDGCNDFSGKYVLVGNSLQFNEEISSTLKFCADVEPTNLTTLLPTIKLAKISGNKLTLTGGETSLEFTENALSKSELVGSWVYVRAVVDGKQELKVQGSFITAVFETSGRFTGQACNLFSGGYTDESGQLKFDEVTSTKRACADERVTNQESLFLERLGKVTSFEKTDGVIKLYFGTGSYLELSQAKG